MNRIYAILALAVALCISLGINCWQYLDRFEREIAAPLEEKILVFEKSTAIRDAVAVARASDDRELLRLRQLLINRENGARTVLTEKVADLPVPTCAPGFLRVDAWNAIAGVLPDPDTEAPPTETTR